MTGPTPHRRSTGSGCRNSSSRPATTSTTPGPGSTRSGWATGLASTDANLARNLFDATPTEHPSVELGAHVVADPPGDRDAVAEQPGRTRHVEERLVEGERLDDRA